MSLVLIIIGTMFFMLLDEYGMALVQRRIGPMNLGWYGVLAALLNGLNLLVTTNIIPMVSSFAFSLWVALVIFFLAFTWFVFFLFFPFSIFSVSFSAFLLLLVLFFALFCLICISAFGASRYSVLGAIRLIAQFIGAELVFSSLVLILVWAYFLLSFGLLASLLFSFQSLLSLFFILSALICILADSNRVPFDISEAESELVAGFLTEVASFYFSILLLAEYSSIIAFSFFLFVGFHLVFSSLSLLLFWMCLIRSSLARLKYDELLVSFWVLLIPLIFSLLLVALVFI